ncbi:MAG: MarR family transcriptional regulator [Archangiaceae bacterium]|nr:MarR family transcriptional regulator [Archangiaceae bacterium]
MSDDMHELALLQPLGEVLDFLRLIWAVSHQLESTSKRMEVELGVTGAQRFVLRLVGRFPGITAGQLAQVLHVNPSTITGVLQRLSRRRLIARRKDPHDARRTFLGLTEAGRAVNGQLSGTVEGAVQQVIEALPERKVAAARDVLAALAQTLAAGGLGAPGLAATARAS